MTDKLFIGIVEPYYRQHWSPGLCRVAFANSATQATCAKSEDDFGWLSIMPLIDSDPALQRLGASSIDVSLQEEQREDARWCTGRGRTVISAKIVLSRSALNDLSSTFSSRKQGNIQFWCLEFEADRCALPAVRSVSPDGPIPTPWRTTLSTSQCILTLVQFQKMPKYVADDYESLWQEDPGSNPRSEIESWTLFAEGGVTRRDA